MAFEVSPVASCIAVFFFRIRSSSRKNNEFRGHSTSLRTEQSTKIIKNSHHRFPRDTVDVFVLARTLSQLGARADLVLSFHGLAPWKTGLKLQMLIHLVSSLI